MQDLRAGRFGNIAAAGLCQSLFRVGAKLRALKLCSAKSTTRALCMKQFNIGCPNRPSGPEGYQLDRAIRFCINATASRALSEVTDASVWLAVAEITVLRLLRARTGR